MTKKIILALITVAVIYLGIVLVGTYLITSSPVYEAAKIQVQSKFGSSATDLHVKWFAPSSFTEGALDGHAEFVLCDRSDCFGIKANKASGVWNVTGAAKR
jgi:hypothetical protein